MVRSPWLSLGMGFPAWDYYRVSNEHYWGYKAREAFRTALKESINSTPLTAAEREEKLKEIPSLVREEEAKVNEAPRERQSQLTEEFWDDCRAELGDYPAAAWEIIRSEAYEQGHSYGYSEVYSKLTDITSFVDRIWAALTG